MRTRANEHESNEALGVAVLEHAQRFAAARQGNPDPDGAEVSFLQQLTAEGINLNDLSESDLRGVAHALGLDEVDEQAFLEDVASWYGRPVS